MSRRALISGLMPFAGLACLVAWPLVFNSPYDLRVFTLVGIYSILVLGYQFIFGHAGALALTQGAFFGIAAYVTGILGAKFGWSFPVTFPLSIVAPVLVAVVVAIPVLRLESHYFALATLGIAQVALLIAIKWESVTGGANGLAGVPGIGAFGLVLPRGYPTLAFVWGIAGVCALVAWWLMRSLRGRAFQLMRTSELAAMSIGLDTARLRFLAFLLSAAFAGIAGALHAHTLRVVSPEVLEFHVMVTCLTMAVIGGRTRVVGAFLGAFLLVQLPEWFRFLEHYYLIAYGGALLAMIIVAPDGLVGLLDRIGARLGLRPRHTLPAPVPLPSAAPEDVTAEVPLLSVNGLTKRFGGVAALEDVSFQVDRGEIVGLIGPNGSGKTTLVNIVTGLTPADAGEVRLMGQDITHDPAFRIVQRGVARTFQLIELVDDMTCLENVAVARLTKLGAGFGRSRSPTEVDAPFGLAKRQAAHLLERLGMLEAAFEPAGNLAQGLRRRLEIARALAAEPRLLLLDEPAAGLNEIEQQDLAIRLKGLRTSGLALVVIEHNVPFLMAIADRLVCLNAGRVIAVGKPSDVRADPNVVAAYFGAQPADGLP